MVRVEYCRPTKIRISAKARHSGVYDALVDAGFRSHISGGTLEMIDSGEEAAIVIPEGMILNHLVKMLARIEKVAENCSDFGKTCSTCGYRGDCFKKIHGELPL